MRSRVDFSMVPSLHRHLEFARSRILMHMFRPFDSPDLSNVDFPICLFFRDFLRRLRLLPRILKDGWLSYASGSSPWKFPIPLLRRDDVSWAPHVTYLLIGISDFAIPNCKSILSSGPPIRRTPTSSDLPTRVPNDGRFRSNLGLRQMQSLTTHLYEPR
jgi:hypothetical protein